MKNNLAIIGVGQLGSRHLQSLADLDREKFNIFVFDTNKNSLEIAKERYKQSVKAHSPKVFYTDDFSELPKEFQTVIVATSSLVRRKAVENLLQQSKVQFLILEKFLFPSIEDYKTISDLILEQGVIAYVNTPRRTFDYYESLKPNISFPFHLTVSGSNWGLACNTIHYLDLFSYFSGNEDIDIINNLDEGIQESKRAGYIEFTGSLLIKDKLHNTLVISSFKEDKRPSVVSISDSKQNIVIHESILSKMMRFFDSGNGYLYEETPIQIKFQSQMSSTFINDLASHGVCKLAPYEKSQKLHIKLLEVFLSHYNRTTQQNHKLCPIT